MRAKRPTDTNPVDKFLRQYQAKVIRIADAGNTDAGKRLLRVGAELLRANAAHMPRYEPILAWFAERLEAVVANPKKAGVELRVARRRGTPPKSADDMHARLRMENVKIAAVIEAANAIKRGVRTGASRSTGKTAYEIASDAIAREYGVRVSPRTIEDWYGQRRSLLPAMRSAGPAK